MKTIKCLGLIVICILCLTGCSIDKSQISCVEDYTDEDTCVQYKIYNCGYQGGMTVKLNQDGTPYLDKECLKEKEISSNENN